MCERHFHEKERNIVMCKKHLDCRNVQNVTERGQCFEEASSCHMISSILNPGLLPREI